MEIGDRQVEGPPPGRELDGMVAEEVVGIQVQWIPLIVASNRDPSRKHSREPHLPGVGGRPGAPVPEYSTFGDGLDKVHERTEELFGRPFNWTCSLRGSLWTCSVDAGRPSAVGMSRAHATCLLALKIALFGGCMCWGAPRLDSDEHNAGRKLSRGPRQRFSVFSPCLDESRGKSTTDVRRQLIDSSALSCRPVSSAPPGSPLRS